MGGFLIKSRSLGYVLNTVLVTAKVEAKGIL